MSQPPLGAVVLYTLGEVRAQPAESWRVLEAQVVAHNLDGTVQLVVLGQECGAAWRAWVPPALAPPGTRGAAGKWSAPA